MDTRLLEEKIKKINALKLQNIKSQLMDEKHKLTETIHHIQSQKSASKYYGTPTLRQKLLERLQEKIKYQESLNHFEECRYQEISQILKKIEKMEEEHQNTIERSLCALKKLCEDFENEISELIKQHKINFIKALQAAACAYRGFYINKNIKNWTKRLNQFLDIFGAVTHVNRSIYPYEIDFEHGFNLQFGRAHRESKKQPILPEKIDLLHLPFSKLIDVGNKMIEECNHYKDDKALDYIELALNKLLSKMPPYFMLKKEGVIFSDLKKIIVVKDDEEVKKELREETIKKISIIEEKLSEDLKDEICQIIQKTSKLIEPLVICIREDIKTIQDEQKKCKEDLEKLAEKLHHEIDSELVQFKNINIKAKENHHLAIESMQKLNDLFESILQNSSKQNREALFAFREESKMHLSDSKNAIDRLCVTLDDLECCKNNIDSKMKDAKDILSSHILSEFDLRYINEFKKYESLKNFKSAIYKEYLTKCEIPEVLFKCAEMSDAKISIQEELDGMQEALSIIEMHFKKLKAEFDEKSSPNFDFETVKKLASTLFVDANKHLQIVIKKSLWISVLKKSVETLLVDLKKTISPELYGEIQELGNTINSQCTLAHSVNERSEFLKTTLYDYTVNIEAEEKRTQAANKAAIKLQNLKIFIRESILSNLHVWRVKGIWGGVDFRHQNKIYRIPHGIAKILTEQNNDWPVSVLKIIHERKREKWSSFFRDTGSTGALYSILQKHLSSNVDSMDSLQADLEKIPGVKLPTSVISVKAGSPPSRG